MNQHRKLTAAEGDQQKYLAARDSSDKDLLAYAAKKTGRSPLKIMREHRRMAKSPSRINLVEYIRNGLYDLDRYTEEERAAFISNDLHWPITYKCSDKNWTAAAEDKMLAATILSAGGVPVPDTVAVLDTSPRLYPNTKKISTAAEFRTLLTEHAGETLFGKIVGGMVSFGAFRIEYADETHVHCSGHAPMSFQDFMDIFVGNHAYVLQRELQNHSGFADYCSALATVRMVNLVTPEGVKNPLAVIKLPQGKNIADAFWRPGNLACEVDVATGRIRTVTLRGIETEFLEDHPEVPGLMGLELPYWPELLKINEQAARIFAPIRYQSTDIAITATGPVVVELNYGGGFDLPQYTSGRGMLTPEVRDFFKNCGVDLKARKKKGFFSRRK